MDAHWRRPRLWAAAFVVFTVIGLSHAAQSYTAMLARAPEVASWAYALVGTMPFWYSKLILLPAVVFTGARWRISDRPRTSVPLHLLVSLAFAGVRLTLGMAIAWSILPPPGAPARFTDELANLFGTYFVTGAVFYWVFLGIFYAIDYARQLHAQRVEAGNLQAQLAEARLQALRSQLNPHFLFNALNAVGALCDRSDTAAASRMVSRIGDLLRMALNRHDQMTTLQQELHFVDTYLEVEQVRLGARMRVSRDIPAGLLDVPVPSLLLQPLVENAVRHGIGRTPGPGVVSISARQDGAGRLRVRVEDSGPGFDFPRPAGAEGDGVGLRNTTARLEQLYGRQHSFQVGVSDLGGACVELVLPEPADRATGAALPVDRSHGDAVEVARRIATRRLPQT